MQICVRSELWASQHFRCSGAINCLPSVSGLFKHTHTVLTLLPRLLCVFILCRFNPSPFTGACCTRTAQGEGRCSTEGECHCVILTEVTNCMRRPAMQREARIACTHNEVTGSQPYPRAQIFPGCSTSHNLSSSPLDQKLSSQTMTPNTDTAPARTRRTGCHQVPGRQVPRLHGAGQSHRLFTKSRLRARRPSPEVRRWHPAPAAKPHHSELSLSFSTP